MANTLNQKEEVLVVELTKQGKKMLSTGFFKPAFFSFFDDSIIYDNSYCKVDENTNDIQDRILNKSLTFSALNILTDLELEKLGTSDTSNDLSPSWSLKVLNGKLNYLKEQSSYYKKYFNFEDIIYNVSLETEEKIPYYEPDYVLIDLEELNVSDDLNNFEIEISVFDELSGGKLSGLERRLSFNVPKNNIIDDILYDEEELPTKFHEQNLTKEDVSYYLDVLVDDEIDTEFITSTEKTIEQKIEGTYTRISAPTKKPC